LAKAGVYVRLRPAVTETGLGHSQDGEKVQKVFEHFDEKSVTIGTQFMFSKGEVKYKFMNKVLVPEVS
jgi:hypothetical protein